MIVEKFNRILEELAEASEGDAKKCEEGNASAGRRLRKASMEIIKQLKELRTEILDKTRK